MGKMKFNHLFVFHNNNTEIPMDLLHLCQLACYYAALLLSWEYAASLGKAQGRQGCESEAASVSPGRGN